MGARDSVRIDFDRLDAAIEAFGMSRRAFCEYIGRGASYLAGAKNLGTLPRAQEAVICRVLGKEPGYFVEGQVNGTARGGEAAILVNIVTMLGEILEKLETLEELEATVTATHKKVHANTVQLEKIKERVGKERG